MEFFPTLLVLMVGVLSVETILSVTLPGFRIRLSKKGLEYVNKVAHTALAKELTSLHIPNQSGHDGHLDWSLTNIQNRGCNIPSSSMTFTPGQNGLTWSMSNLGINLHADWRVKYKKGWVKVSTSGSVDLNVHHVSATVTLRLSVQSGGRPSVSLATCHDSVGSVDVDFHGGTAFILNLFKSVIGDKVKKIMQDQICKVITKEINIDANKKLSQMKVNVEIDHRFTLDYSLIAVPTVHAGDLETLHKGEVFWKGEKTDAPFSPQPIPTSTDESNMLYLWVTDYVAKSFANTAQTHKFLQYNLTENDFPASNKSYLNTTCTFMCIGKLIPQIGKKYPNSIVEARVVSLSPPNLSTTPKAARLAVDVRTDLYAHTPKKEEFYLVTLRLKVSMALHPSVVKERLSGEIVSHSLKVSVEKSAVGKVNPRALNLILGGAMDLAVIPELNTILKKGVELPVTGAVSFQNVKLSLLNGSLLIATDLSYGASHDLTVVSEHHLN